jgi:hypothetical protein
MKNRHVFTPDPKGNIPVYQLSPASRRGQGKKAEKQCQILICQSRITAENK